MKKVIYFLLSVALTFSAAACSGQSDGMELITEKTKYVKSQARTPEKVYSLTLKATGGKDSMPIGCWYGPYQSERDTYNGIETPDYVVEYYYKLMSEAGINFIAYNTAPGDWATGDPEVITRGLDYAAKYNIGCVIKDKYLEGTVRTPQEIDARTAAYRDHPAFMGIFSDDEPNAREMESVKGTIENYSKIFDMSEYLVYSNLFPGHAGGSVLSGTDESITFDTYVRTMAETGINFLSWDHYPYKYENQGTKNISTSYYTDLSTVRKVANEYEVPFWPFIQAGGQWENKVGQFSDPVFPNEGELIWNVNSNIAYGAKAMQYFCFIQPPQFSTSYQIEDYYRNCMIGAAGNINQWYYYIQKANRQLQACAPVLMNAASMGVLKTSGIVENTIYRILPDDVLELPWRELQSVSAKAVNEGADADEGVMVGAFDYKGRSAFYVVNNSPVQKQTVELKFDDKYGYDVIQRAKSVPVAAKTLTLTLEKGEGVLVALK